MNPPKPDPIGIFLILSLLSLLCYAGYLAYQSIDYDILTKLENQKLVLPTPQIPTPVLSP
jgi:hypothetical protein